MLAALSEAWAVELMLPLPSMPTGLNFAEQPIANFLSLLTNNNTYGFAIGVVYCIGRSNP